ncbi:MAG: hypothetical protein TREMPRED_005538 [Tremellales sp. Tagirdzhanova-0007]|nr:MAG: hypothetical protein TREMPRED_005538 [Tremellales sp. Tagirdzhanova-0007]
MSERISTRKSRYANPTREAEQLALIKNTDFTINPDSLMAVKDAYQNAWDSLIRKEYVVLDTETLYKYDTHGPFDSEASIKWDLAAQFFSKLHMRWQQLSIEKLTLPSQTKMTPNEILIEITDEFAIALIETIDYGLRLGHFADDIRLRDHAKSSQIIIASSTLDFEVRRSQIEERYKELGLLLLEKSVSTAAEPPNGGPE